MAEDKEDSNEVPECCDGCLKWQQFGRKCWVYWDRKKTCSQKITSASDVVLQ